MLPADEALTVLPLSSPLPWQAGPRRLWSLGDMTSFPWIGVFRALRDLRDQVDILGKAEAQAEPLTDAESGQIGKCLAKLEGIFNGGSLKDHAQLVARASLQICFAGVMAAYSRQTVGVLLNDLHDDLVEGLGQYSFATVPRERAKYFENSALFGENVKATFPLASDDIREAGNCFATGAYTATIFHLMRTAEHGLRALARKLRVRLRDNKKPQPIDFATWDKVISGCKRKIESYHKLSRGPRRAGKLELYSQVADHCLFMRDIWRDSVSHARKSYIESETQAAMERVRGFMEFTARVLSPRIGKQSS
jgi:hypothetical protein